MGETGKPSYWAVLPAKVRHDPELRPNAKLLYAEITALEDATGYCWASNDYFATLFGLSIKTVSELIGTLARSGYVQVEIKRDPASNEVLERRIWTDRGVGGAVPTPPPKIRETPPPKKQGSPLPKNREENIIYNLNTKNPLPPKGERRRRESKQEPKKEPAWKPQRFAGFWSFYPRGEARQAAIRAWDKLKPADELINAMAAALKRQMAREEWKRGVGIPYASTWLNGRRWEDEPPKADGPERRAEGSGKVMDSEEVPVW